MSGVIHAVVSTYKMLEKLPGGTIVVLNIAPDEWRLGAVPQRMRDVDWANVKCEVVICFDGLDDDPREVWDVPEIQAFCRDALSMPAMIRCMPDERDPKQQAVPGCYGKWSFVMTANITTPLDLSIVSDNPPCERGIVTNEAGQLVIRQA